MPRKGRGAWTAWLVVAAVSAGMSPVSTARAAACPDAQTTAANAPLSQLQGAIACLLNHERRQAGLGDLVMARRLELAAWRHADDMRDHDYFGHVSRDGRTFVDRIRATGYLDGHDAEGWTIGETLAWGHEPSSQPAVIVRALMDSPPHRRVILDGRLREVGIGIVRGTPVHTDDGVTVAIDYGSVLSPASQRRQAPDEVARPASRPKAAKHAKAGRPAKASGPAAAAPAPPPADPPAQPADPPADPATPGKDHGGGHGHGHGGNHGDGRGGE